LAPLLAQGLQLIGNAALTFGKGWVKDKTGVDLDKPTLTSEDYVKLQQYQMQHEEELIKLQQEDNKLDAEVMRMHLQDVQSARTMQVAALTQEDLFSKRFIYYFAIGWSIVTATYLGFITFGSIPEENIRFADTILGFILGTLVSTIINFFYGTSFSSKNKTEAFKELLMRRKE
jgi:hypothetical protein